MLIAFYTQTKPYLVVSVDAHEYAGYCAHPVAAENMMPVSVQELRTQWSARTLSSRLYFLSLVVVPIARWPIAHVAGVGVQLVDVLMAATYVAFAFAWAQHPSRLKIDAVLICSSAYFAILIASCFISEQGSARGVLKVMGYAPMLFWPVLSAHLLTNERDLFRMSQAWFLGTAFVAVIGALTLILFYINESQAHRYFLCGYGGLSMLPIPRLCAPFNNMNMLANYALVSFCLFVGTYFPRLPRKQFVLFAGIILSIVILTVSAALGGLGLAIAFLGFHLTRAQSSPFVRAARSLIAIGAIAFAVVVIASMTGSLVERGQGTFRVGTQDYLFMDGPRPSIWKGAVETIRTHPWMGLGYGTLVAPTTDLRAWRSRDAWATAKDAGVLHHMEAHNAWLNIAGQVGIPGLLVFWALLLSIVHGVPRSNDSVSPSLRVYKRGIEAALLGAIAFHSLFSANEEARHLWMLLGLAAALGSILRTNIANAPPPSATNHV